MNYNKIYCQLIDKVIKEKRVKKVNDGLERHHIKPRSLGGADDKSNLVCLTTREHFIAHKMLTKIYTGEDKNKMLYALWWMCKTRHLLTHPTLNGAYRVKARDYEYARKLYNDNHPNRDAARKERYKERRAAGLHKKCDELLHSENMKKMLAKLTLEELTERSKNSWGKCDQEARAAAMKKGKSSLIELTRLDGSIIQFDTTDKEQVKLITGLAWQDLRYRINRYGSLVTGEQVKYLRKFTHKGRYGTNIDNS